MGQRTADGGMNFALFKTKRGNEEERAIEGMAFFLRNHATPLDPCTIINMHFKHNAPLCTTNCIASCLLCFRDFHDPQNFVHHCACFWEPGRTGVGGGFWWVQVLVEKEGAGPMHMS